MRFQKFPNSWGRGLRPFTRMGLPSTQNQWIRSPKSRLFETAVQRGLRPVHTNPGKKTCGCKKVWIRVDAALVYSKLSAVTVNFGREPWQSILTSLPPRVHNDTPLLSHHLIIPMPCLGVNWFTNYKMKNKKIMLNAVHSTENISDFLVWKHNKYSWIFLQRPPWARKRKWPL